jgi:hypothetical protein
MGRVWFPNWLQQTGKGHLVLRGVQMKRGKLTLECSCGNQKNWKIMSQMKPTTRELLVYSYSIDCIDCGASRILGKSR